MQFSEQWLRSYAIPPLSSDELADLLTMAGLEVESNEPVAPPFSGCRGRRGQACRAASERRQADRVPGRCRRRQQLLSIVCGAPNVAAGMKAPCALVGAITARRHADQGGHAARRAVAGHAVLRARARAVRRPRRPADSRRRRSASGHDRARLSCSSTTAASRSSSRPIGPIACACSASRAKWRRSTGVRRCKLPGVRPIRCRR